MAVAVVVVCDIVLGSAGGNSFRDEVLVAFVVVVLVVVVICVNAVSLTSLRILVVSFVETMQKILPTPIAGPNAMQQARHDYGRRISRLLSCKGKGCTQ